MATHSRRDLVSIGLGLTLVPACVASHGVASQQTVPIPHASDERARRRSMFWESHDREMLSRLEPLRGAHVLDAGCGSGDHALVFAALGCARVVALDLDSEKVERLSRRVAGSALASRVEPRVGDVTSLPFDASTFDLVWSSHVLHFMVDPTAVVQELARVTRRRGRVVVREDRSLTRLLPFDVGLGRPGLESRAVAAFDEWLASDRVRRGRVPYGWLGVLRRAGLTGVRAHSVLFELQAPFDETQAAYLRDLIAWRAREGLSPEDRNTLAALSVPGGPHDALARDDLHFVSVSSLYLGQV
ncbi:MAG: class I SAM-dependent methyltransferase [Sandaracinaceae bacterium]